LKNIYQFYNIRGINFFNKIKTIITCISQDGSLEEQAEIMYRKALALKDSPDAFIEHLDSLASFHEENGYYAEYIQVRILQAATMLEYLSLFGKINFNALHAIREIQKDNKLQHPASLLLHVSSCVKHAFCSEQMMRDLPRIPTFCDSARFNERGLILLLRRTSEAARAHKLFEISLQIADVLWSLFESRQALNGASQCVEISQQAASELSRAPDESRLLGKYYRVAFFGKQLPDNGKMFIYHEKLLTTYLSSQIVCRKATPQELRLSQNPAKLMCLHWTQKIVYADHNR